VEHLRKPHWLRAKPGNNANFTATATLIRTTGLHTICQSGRCPNRGECWNHRTATFLIGGDICTRACKFCNTRTGKPLPLDPDEPRKVAESIRCLGLSHAVITSVDRDDLPDAGAAHWASTIRTIRDINPCTSLEALIPDFRGRPEPLDTVIETRPDILSHNIETVRRLTPLVRSVARYDTSLAVLHQIAQAGIPAKSSLMLGLGETEAEVLQTLADLRQTGCSLLAIGQYLQPSRKNLPVSAYLPPETFDRYRQEALAMNFAHVESSPLTRSSYRSAHFLRQPNSGASPS
jgi:lipoic acid synthetase